MKHESRSPLPVNNLVQTGASWYLWLWEEKRCRKKGMAKLQRGYHQVLWVQLGGCSGFILIQFSIKTNPLDFAMVSFTQ